MSDYKEKLSKKDHIYTQIVEKQSKLLEELEDIKDGIFQIENEIQNKETELIEKISQIEKDNQKLNGLLHLKNALLERENRIDEEEKEILNELQRLDNIKTEKELQKK